MDVEEGRPGRIATPDREVAACLDEGASVGLAGALAAPQLSVWRVDAGDGVVVVGVAGEVDLVTAPVVSRILEQEGSARKVVVNLSAVAFLGAAGVSALLRASRELQRGGTGLAIAGASPFLDRVLRAVEVDHVVPLYGAEGEAVTSV